MTLSVAGGQPVPGLSAITLGSGLSGIGAAAAIGREVDNKISYGENLTWQKGSHLLKLGGQAVRYRQKGLEERWWPFSKPVFVPGHRRMVRRVWAGPSG